MAEDSDRGVAEVTLVLRFTYDDELHYARTLLEIGDRSREYAELVSIDVERRKENVIERR